MMRAQDEYTKFAAKLVDLFDLDWDKYAGRITAAYDFLKHIPAQAFEPMVKIAIDKWDGWPKNWAKAVKDIYEEWRREAKFTGAVIKYDPVDDVRFPVHLMQQAYDILRKKDYPSYVYFCDQVGMPKTDRDRVENKHRICQANDQHKYRLPEVGRRANRKEPRAEIARLRESFAENEFPF